MSDPTHSHAADAYGKRAADGDPRALEAHILLKAAQKLESLQKRLEKGETPRVEETGEILEYNQKLWQLFLDDTKNDDHPLPQEIKNNIATLGVFIFKRTLELMADMQAERLQVLININRNIAAGLMKGSAPDTTTTEKEDARPLETSMDSTA